MKEVNEGDLCHRCQLTPILDPRIPFCSECRSILEKETADGVRERKSEDGVKKGVFTYNLKTGKKRFSMIIPGMGKKHKK
jgi:hypothetical protein